MIYIRVSNKGLRFEVSTKIKLPIGYTLHPEIGVSGKTKLASTINQDIREFMANTQGKIKEAENAGGKITFEKVKNFVMGTNKNLYNKVTFQNIIHEAEQKFSGSRVFSKKTGRLLEPNTLTAGLGVAKRLIKACPDIDLDFEIYNAATIKIHGSKFVKDKYKAFVRAVKEALMTRYMESTIWSAIVTLRLWINDTCSDADIFLGSLLSDLTYPAPQNPIAILDREQTDYVLVNHKKILHECNTAAQAGAVEYFIAGYITMARISDMRKWTQANLVKAGEETYLRYEQSKLKNVTGKTITIPIPEMLLALFNKNIFAFNGKILPVIGHAVNYNLRMALKKYDVFDKPATKERTKAGERVGTADEGLRTYDVLYIHMVRATAITHMLEDGATAHEVKQFSGHSTNSTAFERYAGELTLEAKQKIYNRFLMAVSL